MVRPPKEIATFCIDSWPIALIPTKYGVEISYKRLLGHILGPVGLFQHAKRGIERLANSHLDGLVATLLPVTAHACSGLQRRSRYLSKFKADLTKPCVRSSLS